MRQHKQKTALQAVEDDADLLLGRILLAGGPADVAYKRLGWFLPSSLSALNAANPKQLIISMTKVRRSATPTRPSSGSRVRQIDRRLPEHQAHSRRSLERSDSKSPESGNPVPALDLTKPPHIKGGMED